MSIKQRLSQIDDEYLIGISNKGIVKRAYKDFEQTNMELTDKDDIIEVSVEDCTCELVWPIADSKCTCPSRSICKHIVMAVLYAKNKFGSIMPEDDNTVVNESESTDLDTNTIDETQTVIQKDNTDKIKYTNKIKDTNTTIDTYLTSQYSIDIIQKKLGKSVFKKAMDYMLLASEPKITITSVITVYFEDTDNTVKLIEPIEYSTCTCHKKELCIHKALAILYYQLSKGLIKKEDLEAATDLNEKQVYDCEKIGELIVSVYTLIGELMFSGLSRISNEMTFSFERMALMCHNLLLPEYERRFRALSETLDLYFGRHASFSIYILINELTELYKKISELQSSLDGGDIASLAGKNRSEYKLIRPLDLVGMGHRFFHSKTGYEGETIYFLEANTGEWYTYTNARPVFYDNNEKTKLHQNSTYQKKQTAPWGINVSMEELSQSAIHLTNVKVNDENRLSSTNEATAQISGKRRFLMECANRHIYEDFERLFEDKFGKWYSLSELKETRKLVIVEPAGVQEAEFDIVSQKFSMILLDKEERRLVVKVSYSKEEKNTINYLERLYKRIEKGLDRIPLFFGIVYIEDGQLRLYPIEDYEKQDKQYIHDYEKTDGLQKEDYDDNSDAVYQKQYMKQMKVHFNNCMDALCEVLQSGFMAVSEDTLNKLKFLSQGSGQRGLSQLQIYINELYEALSIIRHQIKRDMEDEKALMELFCKIRQYLELGINKISYDEVKSDMKNCY